MKRIIKTLFLLSLIGGAVFVGFEYKKFKANKIEIQKNNVTQKKYFNIVLIGAAGSGKGTQGNFIKEKMNLLQLSAGDVFRAYRKDENAKYTKLLEELMNQGKLVPQDVAYEIISQYAEKNVFSGENNYNGIIFDGYPRQIETLKMLDEFLEKHNNKIDAVVYIDIPVQELVDRLKGRYSCAQCGELYHKTTKPTKVEGVCDKCGGTHFNIRDDDQNEDAIRERFKIFENETKLVLDEYEKRGIVIRVDGRKQPEEISTEIIEKLESIKNK